MSVIRITVRNMSGFYQFRRDRPDEPLADREPGSVWVYGKTHYGIARRNNSGQYEFAI